MFVLLGKCYTLTINFQPAAGAEWGIAATLRRQAAEKRRIEERRAKVQLYRSYRTGELPDIQGVKISGFVAPMGQMASKDTTAACMVVSAVARMVVDAVQDHQLDLQVSSSTDTYPSVRAWVCDFTPNSPLARN